MQLDMSKLNPMQLGRVQKALSVKMRYDGVIRTLAEQIASLPDDAEKRELDGMCDWSRTKFNRMDGKAQREYETKLRARRYYSLAGWTVPKIIYDIAV